MDVQAKEQAEAVRCLSLEKEARTFEELLHLRGTYVQRLDITPSSVNFRTICILVFQRNSSLICSISLTKLSS